MTLKTKWNTHKNNIAKTAGAAAICLVVGGSIAILDKAESASKRYNDVYNQALTSYANYHNKPVEDEATQNAFATDFLESIQTSYAKDVKNKTGLRVRFHNTGEEMTAKTAINLLESYKPE